MIKINVKSICVFAYIKVKATWTTDLIHGDDIPTDKLINTNWKDFEDPIHCWYSHSELFPCLFWARPTSRRPQQWRDHGKACLFGSGYELWANTAKAAVEYVDYILTVMDEIKASKMTKRYLDPARNGKSLQLAMANGPFGAMTNVQSDDYPLATRVLKEIFQLTTHIFAPPLPSVPTGNVMLQLPSEIDKESETKKGIIKLMLLLVCGDIDIESTSVSNISLVPPSKGMQVVLNQLRAAQASVEETSILTLNAWHCIVR